MLLVADHNVPRDAFSAHPAVVLLHPVSQAHRAGPVLLVLPESSALKARSLPDTLSLGHKGAMEHRGVLDAEVAEVVAVAAAKEMVTMITVVAVVAEALAEKVDSEDLEEPEARVRSRSFYGAMAQAERLPTVV